MTDPEIDVPGMLTHFLDEERIAAGAAALQKAFPTLADDFTPAWFEKVAQIVLDAADGH